MGAQGETDGFSLLPEAVWQDLFGTEFIIFFSLNLLSVEPAEVFKMSLPLGILKKD